MKTISKQVKDLQTGDTLDSGTVVVEKPFDQVHTPKNKTNLVVVYPNGTKKFVTWGKSTIVKVMALELKSFYCDCCGTVFHLEELQAVTKHKITRLDLFTCNACDGNVLTPELKEIAA